VPVGDVERGNFERNKKQKTSNTQRGNSPDQGNDTHRAWEFIVAHFLFLFFVPFPVG